MADLIGKIFDHKYRLTRLIGEGGMGAVYEAEHTRIERKVAVKVMHPEFSTTTEVADRFFREAQASSAIGHPNIIEIFDVGKFEDGTAFIVMELLEGESLSDRMERERQMPPDTAVAIILQVLSALSMAHQKGIIHRDLKPDNVFLSIDARGRHEVKLLDFGIAKVQGDAEGDQGLTKTGTVLGTPNYMSPEQARGKDIDARIDIWAAGVMLYEMLSGGLPFQGESYNAVLSDILLESPRPLKELSPNTPPPLLKIIERAMEKDRDLRYPNVQLMIEELLNTCGEAGTLMSDSAHSALKSSIAPPPAIYKNPDLGDTAAISPDPSIVRVMSSSSGQGGRVGNVTFRELEFGKGEKGEVGRPRRTLFWILASVLVLFGAIFIGLTLNVKQPDQSFIEAGISLFQGLKSNLEESSWSPFKKPPAVTPKIDWPDMASIPSAPSGELDGGCFEIEDKNEITIELLGTTPKSKIFLGGKPMLSRMVIKKSDKPILLKVISPGQKPYIKKITPSENLVVDTKKRPPKRGKKKKRRKRTHKKR